MFLADVAIAILLKISGFQVSELLVDFSDQLWIQQIVTLIKKFTHFPQTLKIFLSCLCQCHLISSRFCCLFPPLFHPPVSLLCTSPECSFDPFVLALHTSIGKVIFPLPIQPNDAFLFKLFKMHFEKIFLTSFLLFLCFRFFFFHFWL